MEGEGRAWLERNQAKLPPIHDPVMLAIKSIGIRPTRVLEIGCADGWRVSEIARQYGSEVDGLDPSVSKNGFHNGVYLHRGTAEKLPYSDNAFDLVIYGFCLYLCDPEDYFKIMAECDRVLSDNGIIIVYDFYSEAPHSRIYEHKEGVYSHKMDFSKLWLGHPGYYLVTRHIMGNGNDMTALLVLKKRMAHSFPVMHE